MNARLNTIAVDGADLRYTAEGDGPPLLLIHGGGPDLTGWLDIPVELARDHRVIRYDRRGFGESEHEPVADYRRHGEDAAAIVRALDVAPAVVVGWSSGGIVALDLAVHHPELVSSLVLMEPLLHGRKHISPAVARAFVATQIVRRLRGDRAAADRWFRFVTAWSDGGSTWARDDIPQARRERMLGNATALFSGDMRADDSYLTLEKVGGIACPVTCLLGERSNPWFERALRPLEDALPDVTRRTIPGCNHAFATERPAETAEAIRQAVADASARLGRAS